MKIGILTHPLRNNYGGILQAYALNVVLKHMGHETIMINRVIDRSNFIIRLIRFVLKSLHHPRYYVKNRIDKQINIRPFVENKFNITDILDTPKKIKSICDKYDLEAVIVGSDQVWRADYAMSFSYNYFLDFVPNDIKKISYASSFGVSGWQYNEKQTEVIKFLLNRFNAISVREDEGVEMLTDIGIKAEHLLDPTLLLSSIDYDKIASPRTEKDEYIFVYWLGEQNVMNKIIDEYNTQGKKIIKVNLRDNVEQISIEDWISYIKYANLVITDSFHGCVFSIIYNKKFYIFSNDSGGNRRLNSFFKQLDILDKTENPFFDIDYNKVNIRIEKLQEKAILFLNQNL